MKEYSFEFQKPFSAKGLILFQRGVVLKLLHRRKITLNTRIDVYFHIKCYLMLNIFGYYHVCNQQGKTKNGETSDIDAYFHLYCPFLQFAAVDLMHQCSDVKNIV